MAPYFTKAHVHESIEKRSWDVWKSSNQPLSSTNRYLQVVTKKFPNLNTRKYAPEKSLNSETFNAVPETSSLKRHDGSRKKEVYNIKSCTESFSRLYPCKYTPRRI